MPLRVLIVGASIAGPTAAFWFAKAGAAVTVIERFPAFREGGQNVDIRSVGVTVMQRMGIEAEVRSHLSPITGFRLVREDNSEMATMHQSGDVNQQALISEFEIPRGNLAKIIYDKTLDKVKYIFNEQIASIQQIEDIVNVEFQSGKRDTFDLVVAADGATSRTRAIGLGCGVRDHIISQNAFSAYCSTTDKLTEGTLGIAWCKAPGRFYAVGPDEDPKLNRIGLISVFNNSEEIAPFQKALKGDRESLAEYLVKRFGGQGWKSDEIAKALSTSPDLYASEMVQVKAPSLSKGRFVMVGDAGHAAGPTGTGTSLAMCGAYVLAGEISSHSTVEEGLKAYEERMRPIIKICRESLLVFQESWHHRLNGHCGFEIWSSCSSLSVPNSRNTLVGFQHSLRVDLMVISTTSRNIDGSIELIPGKEATVSSLVTIRWQMRNSSHVA
ncbi:hypothetical protein MRB53_041682 [Persea americana]|nr:hypothetical protein MRB53_041682 [Persea americana]